MNDKHARVVPSMAGDVAWCRHHRRKSNNGPHRRSSSLLSLSLSLLLCWSLQSSLLPLGADAQGGGGGEPVTVTFIHVNDHHSHFDEESFEIFDDDVPPGLSVETSELRVYYGGAAKTTTAIRATTEAAMSEGDDVCLLHAGDAITGTLFYTLLGSEPDAAVMNAVGFDVMAVGNHEFDDGDANLAEFIDRLNMPVISANVVPGPDSPLNDVQNGEGIPKFFVKTLSNGDTIGICGLSPRVKTMEASFPDSGTFVRPEIEAAAECVEELEALGVNKIVLLSHAGYDRDRALARRVPGVDVIIGGDSHTLLGSNSFDRLGLGNPEGPYATTTNGVCIVQAWEYFKIMGSIRVRFDEEGNVIDCLGTPIVPLNEVRYTVRDADPRFDLSPDDAKIAADYLVDKFPSILLGVEDDPEIADILQPFRDSLSEQADQVIAVAEENICHTRGDEVDPLCPDRDTQTRLGGSVCLIASQAFLFKVPQADFAIQNSGGCRTDILEGDVTFSDLVSVLPFLNTLVTLEMTGDQIRRLLEDAYANFLDNGGSDGSFPASAGLRWEANYNAPFGERVSNIQMYPRLGENLVRRRNLQRRRWMPLDMEATFTVVTNSFIAQGLDGYLTFLEIPPEDITDTFVEYSQSLVDLAREREVLRRVPDAYFSSQRIVFEDGTVAQLPTPAQCNNRCGRIKERCIDRCKGKKKGSRAPCKKRCRRNAQQCRRACNEGA